MISSASSVARFKWCALAVVAITVLSLMPQVRFWLVRGAQWQGSYSILQLDEVLYSAYVNALIDGRPRRSDPATGQDDHSQAPLPESLFSIQFMPPFIIAWAARTCGASASTAFIALLGAAGLFASLSLVWLLVSIIEDSKLAAVGMLVVLCFGTPAGGQGLIGLLLNLDVRFLGLPFLRRYEPSAAFPLFFVFCTLVWQALTTAFKRATTLKAFLAGVTLGLLMFSYFFLWTAAAAWLVSVWCLWVFLRPVDRGQATRVFILTMVPVILSLVLYSYLVSRLPVASDRAWVHTVSHRPDLLRVPEIIGALILVTLIIGVRKAKISFNEPQVIFAAFLGAADVGFQSTDYYRTLNPTISLRGFYCKLRGAARFSNGLDPFPQIDSAPSFIVNSGNISFVGRHRSHSTFSNPLRARCQER